MDIKEMLKWSWNHRLWFGISLLVCLGLGTLYFFSCTPKRSVSATIMLRTADIDSQQGQMMSIMGEAGSKKASDEIKILTSRDLMAQIVDSLHMYVTVSVRQGLRIVPVYPLPDFAMEYKPAAAKKEKFTLIHNDVKYKVQILPFASAVARSVARLGVTRSSRESNIITLATVSTNPKQAEDMLNMLLTLYNEAADKDKNIIALQTQTFLDERIAAVQAELNEAESLMEVYKSTHQITNIEATASEYQKLIEDYQLQLADVNFEIRVLNDLQQQLLVLDTKDNPHTLYADLAEGTLKGMMEEYNRNIARRIVLLESATVNNPMVSALNRTLTSQSENLKIGVQEAKTTAQTRQQHLTEQIRLYQTKLSQLPEQERTYVEMKRNVEAKEQQYLYLIEKREENALLLASSSFSAKVVEKAQRAARLVSPNVKRIALGSVFMGLLLPLIVFFFGMVKKEFM